MAADENVLDFEVSDGELDDRERVDVGGGDNIGDVAVDKDLTRLEAENGCLGDAGVGASNPENLGRLTGSLTWEEVRVGRGSLGAPFADTVGQRMGEAVCTKDDGLAIGAEPMQRCSVLVMIYYVAVTGTLCRAFATSSAGCAGTRDSSTSSSDHNSEVAGRCYEERDR